MAIIVLALALAACSRGSGGQDAGNNTPPVPRPLSFTLDEDTSLTDTLLADDADGDNLLFRIIDTATALGSVTLTDPRTGRFRFTPQTNAFGEDTFKYVVSDGKSESAPTAVILKILPVDDPPIAVDDRFNASSLAETVLPSVLDNDQEPDGDPLTVTDFSPPQSGTLIHRGAGVFAYTANAGYVGPDSFTYTISDGTTSATATVQLTITASLPPQAQDDTAQVDEDSTVAIDVLANDSDPEGNAITVEAATAATNGTVNLNKDGTIQYTPAPDFFGSDQFTYTVRDSAGITASAVVSVTVNPTADPPQIDPIAASSAAAGSTVSFTVSASDPDGPAPALGAVNLPPNATFTDNGNGKGTFSWPTTAADIGDTTVTFTANDGTTTVSTDVVISIVANQAPDGQITAPTAPVDINLGSTVDFTASGADPDDHTPLTFRWELDGTLLQEGPQATLSHTFSSAGAFTVTLITIDALGLADPSPATLTVNVIDTNTPPDATIDQTPQNLTVVAGQSIVFSGTVSDTENNGPFSYLWSFGDPAIPDATVEDPGAVQYDNYGVYTVTFSATDGSGATDPTPDTRLVYVVPPPDDFNDNNFNGWTVVNDSNNTTPSWTANSDWRAENGVLKQKRLVRVHGRSFDGSYHLGTYVYLNGATSLTDYRFGVDITVKPASSQFLAAEDVGVLFRYQDDNNYYRLSFNRNYGFTRLEVKKNGVFFPLATVSRAYANNAFHVDVEVQGDRLFVFVDGDGLFAVRDTRLATGSVGLYSQEIVDFDNVTITANTSAPTVVLSRPLAYSAQSSQTLTVEAYALNAPPGSRVEFTLDGGNPKYDSTSPYQSQYSGVAKGNHTVTARLLDSADTELARDTNVTVGTGGSYRITVGDSITNGDFDFFAGDNISADGRILAESGWQANLSDLLNAAGHPSIPTILFNEGVGGDTSDTGVFDRLSSILDRHPDADEVLILFGTNDAGSTQPVPSGLNCSGAACAGTFKENLRALIDTVNAAGMTPIIAQPSPNFGPKSSPTADPLNSSVNVRLKEYGQVIRGEDANPLSGHIIGPDFFAPFLSATVNRYSLFHDSVHPNAYGYVVLAYLWRNHFTGDTSLPFLLENIQPYGYQQTLMEVGDPLYSDQSFTVTGIPALLNNGLWVITANADRNIATPGYISFDVDRAVDLYVAYDAAVAPPGWMPSSSFDPVAGATITTTNSAAPSLQVYRFTPGVNAGATVVLDGPDAAGTGAGANYTVIVVPR